MENDPRNLTNEEKDWIIGEIQSLLSSSHDCRGTNWTTYKRRDEILRRGITEEAWNWNYDLTENELKIMKKVWGKLHG